jgi:Raf kinase inhibitor-like YbhB/YbcL family protein
MRVPTCVLAIVMLGAAAISSAAERSSFALSSPDVAAGGQIPEQFVLNDYGCTGGNVSPALKWRGAPAGTKSFVITLFDPDEHNTPSGWWHWVVYDIPATSTELSRDAGAEHGQALPAGALQGRSDLGNPAYHGPCPDKGDRPHRYTFTIYALKVDKLPVAAGASGAMVTYTLQEHVLAKATLVARHVRR